MPARRPHKKSRRGCVECKRRHRKCDESRPACVNCSTAQLRCSYLDLEQQSPSPAAPSATPRARPATQPTPTATPPTFSPATRTVVSPLRNDAGTGQAASQAHMHVDMHHMELLSHFLLETCQSFGIDRFSAHSSMQVIMASALATPYLMYELLALSALHLSQLRGAQTALYRAEAAELQTHSLSLFNSANAAADVNADNCVPMFLFSSLMGIYMLGDAVTAPDKSSFLDDFVGYLDIHRGVRAITGRAWELLRATGLKPLFDRPVDALARAHPATPRPRDARLWRLLDDADLGPAPLNACRDAAGHLQWVFDSERETADQLGAMGVVFAWPVLLSADFTDLLLRRCPEALVILAHYAVLLHAQRRLWIVADAGRLLIEFITAHLGKYWKDWLAWPNAVLAETASSPVT